MRLNYSDDEDFPGQFNIWQANCNRSLQGKKGQAALKRLEAALVAMPIKRLIREVISEVDDWAGRLDVCALGAVAMMEGREDVLYSDREPTDAGVAMGFPRLVAWKVVEQNDIQLDTRLVQREGPELPTFSWRHRLYPEVVEMSPEERYTAMLAWVRSQIREQA